MKNSYLGELRSEFLGTMILILFGVGVTLGGYMAARLSGAYLNPAVRIALAAFKGFAWRKVLPTRSRRPQARSWG